MTNLTRRQLGLGLGTSALASALPSFGQAAENTIGRVAIIDSSMNTTPFIPRLEALGVQVVARYYALTENITGKCLALNTNKEIKNAKPEWITLQEHGLGILSCYQHFNANRKKFQDDFNATPMEERRRFEDGVALTPASRRFEKEINKGRHAYLDAKAARDQAAIVGQPDNTPIYFGVDFELDDKRWERVQLPEKRKDGRVKMVWKWQRTTHKGARIIDYSLRDAVYNYFYKIHQLLGDRLGVYGSGFTCRMLREAKLVNHTWIAESRSFVDTAKYLNDGQWTLFQNEIDTAWFVNNKVCGNNTTRLELDTDVQNPGTNLGAWGGKPISADRTKDIFDAHRVAVRSVPVFKEKNENSPQVTLIVFNANTNLFECRKGEADRNRTVRVIRDDKEWLYVDVNDDGQPDGYVRAFDPKGRANFRTNIYGMPDYHHPEI